MTEEGRQKGVQIALENVDKSLEVIDRITSQMLSKSQELAARREEARHIIHTIAQLTIYHLKKRYGKP